jgi:hypothetical protein
MTADAFPPRVLIVMSDDWRRALIRAALREVGYDAIGTQGSREAWLAPPEALDRGPVRLIIVDQDALSPVEIERLSALRQRFGGDPDILLLARTTVAPPDGPWHRVLRRPVSVAEIVSAAEELVPLSAELRHAIDAR